MDRTDQGQRTSTGAMARAVAFVRLARPHQWVKSAFVLVGPLYGMGDAARHLTPGEVWPRVGLAAAAFALASSACYVVNDVLDAPADRQHPRKCRRPVASGEVPVGAAWVFAGVLLVAATVLVSLIPVEYRWMTALAAGLYVANVSFYSAWAKHVIIADVMGLSLGFVLRVMGGCAAAGITPSTWLLNCTFFLAMFLAFGKRLGERRTMGSEARAAEVRAVHAAYTDEMLRMAVVVTAVVTLLSYAAYVQARESQYTQGFNLLWLTVLPATFGTLRCIVLLERGDYDDPTELAIRDRPFGASALVFAVLTVWLALRSRGG